MEKFLCRTYKKSSKKGTVVVWEDVFTPNKYNKVSLKVDYAGLLDGSVHVKGNDILTALEKNPSLILKINIFGELFWLSDKKTRFTASNSLYYAPFVGFAQFTPNQQFFLMLKEAINNGMKVEELISSKYLEYIADAFILKLGLEKHTNLQNQENVVFLDQLLTSAILYVLGGFYA